MTNPPTDPEFYKLQVCKHRLARCKKEKFKDKNKKEEYIGKLAARKRVENKKDLHTNPFKKVSM